VSTVVGGRVLAHAGDDAQRRRWLPGICEGSRFATFAFLEAGARWDLEGVTAAARPVSGGWSLAGTKLFVPDAHVADVVVCACAVPTTASPFRGPRAWGGEAHAPSERRCHAQDLRARSRRRVRPADHLLAGDATTAVAAVLDEARVALAADMTGGAERVLEMTVEHVKARQQFGQPIGPSRRCSTRVPT